MTTSIPSPLKKALETQTQELLTQYLLETEKWATNQFEKAEEMYAWTKEQWVEKFPFVKEGTTETVLSKQGKWRKEDVTTIHNRGREKHLAKAAELANFHYQQSLDKLVYRLVAKKGVPETTTDVVVERAALDYGFNIVVKFGEVTVKAWTIVAQGLKISAHLRFLVY